MKDPLSEHSGWHEFARMPETASWARLRRHLAAWTQAQLVDSVCNLLGEATLDFTVAGWRFRIDEEESYYRLFAADSDVPRDVTDTVKGYCRQLLAGGEK